MKINIIWVLIFLIIIVSGCIQYDYKEYNKQPVLNHLEMEKSIHNLINYERKKVELGELEFDENLADIARLYSFDMAEKGFFSHYDLNGNGFEYRYKQAGYNCTNSFYIGGENLFFNNIAISVYEDNSAVAEYATQQEIVISTVEGWMNSPGHRSNILTEAWKEEGIGVYVAVNGNILITQNFC